MMDVDDGYILWTGIWKGTSPFTSRDHFIQALFYSLGEFKRFLLNPSLRNDGSLYAQLT
jgi:hypothetical protein